MSASDRDFEKRNMDGPFLDELDRLRVRGEKLEQQLAESHATILEQSKTIADLARQTGEAARRIASAPSPVRDAMPGDGVRRTPWEHGRRAPMIPAGGYRARDVEQLFEPEPATPAAAPEAPESAT